LSRWDGIKVGESLVTRIKGYVASQPRPITFPPSSENDVGEAEKRLGFSIPPLLKSIYLEVGNGGFGPGRGRSIIGVKGGYASDFGTLVETYKQLKDDFTLERNEWIVSLLPFCEWGCNIFTCVNCNEPNYQIYLFEEGDVSLKQYTLQDFFEMWIGSVDILSYEGPAGETAEVTNPFTGEMSRVTKRRQK
jgi:SMI1-KNR4 cell-wall